MRQGASAGLARRLGGLFAGDEGGYLRDAVQVFGKHLVILDLNAKLILEEGHDLEHASGVDDAAVEEGDLVAKGSGIGHIEIAGDEASNAFDDAHSIQIWDNPARFK